MRLGFDVVNSLLGCDLRRQTRSAPAAGGPR